MELQVSTPSEQEIQMTRQFAAPRSRVYQGWSNPEWVPRWMGPADRSLAVREFDLRVGGGYRFTWRGADGAETGEQGTYTEIVPGERIAWTNTFDDWFSGEVLVTTTFEEHDGVTTVVTTVRFPTTAARETVLHSDVGTALSACYARLDALLAVSV